MEREKEVELKLRTEVEKLGGVFWKFTSPGNTGVPDRIAIFPDCRLVFVELKTAVGRLSPLQKYQIRRLIELRQQVCIVRGEKGAQSFLYDMKAHSLKSIDYRSDGDIVPLEEAK